MSQEAATQQVKKYENSGEKYVQGRHSNQCHRAMALVVFLPRPESQYISQYIYWVPRKITLKSPKWHWLILSLIGANAYRLTIADYDLKMN